MSKNYKYLFFLICYYLISSQPLLFAQTVNNTILKNYINQINIINRKIPAEKVYLQVDKPYYNMGDTLRFKAYLLNADYLSPSTQSGLLYVQLDDVNNKSQKQIVIPITYGTGWGDIVLDERDIREGSYILRAYTNWMQNFGEDYIFKKPIYISANNSIATLVEANFKLDTTTDKNKLQAAMRFTNLNKNPVMLMDMDVKLYNGSRWISRYKLQTDIEGGVKVDFNIRDKVPVKNLAIRAHRTAKGEDTTSVAIPVFFNRPEKTDLQFMPEGGYLVEGLKTKMGFKAISEDGKGVNISGKIVNSHQQEKSNFESIYKGMGSFEITPEPGEKYFANITLPNGIIKSYPLPVVNITGTILKVAPNGNDSLDVTISATPGLPLTQVYLIAQARSVVCYAGAFGFAGLSIKKTIPKSLFPTGIVRFTVFNAANQPLNERIVYINRHDDLHIDVKPAQVNYTTRDSIALTIQVNDKNGKPVKGAFSLAVTDDDQVKIDSAGGNMINNILFTSDLKGDIENPGHYFDAANINRNIELDNLLLTQGWVGYNWDKVFDVKTESKYRAEREFVVQGKATNVFNKPVKQTRVTLFRKSPLLFMETLTNDEGRFVFRDTDLLTVDSAYFLVQAVNKNGKSFNIDVELDEVLPPELSPVKQIQLPWYVNTDKIILNNNKTKLAQIDAEDKLLQKGNVLKEVKIKEKKMIPGSKNPDPELNDEVWDKREMDAARNMTIFDMIKRKHQAITNIGTAAHPLYLIDGHYIVVLRIDGLPGNPPDFYLNYLTASDVRGIEVRYMMGGRFDVMLMHVTTYSGNGAYLKHTPGIYAYKPIPLSVPSAFYKPKYTAKNKNIAMGTDMRSTIHWEPNITTDTTGKAIVSFFSADKPSKYNVWVEGTDFQGNVGSKQSKINIAAKQQYP